MRLRQQGIARLQQDVEGEGEEGGADEPQRDALARLTGSRQLPHHHQRGEELDQRVEAEAGECHRMRLVGGYHDDDHPDDIPAEGRVFQIEPAPEQRRGRRRRDHAFLLDAPVAPAAANPRPSAGGLGLAARLGGREAGLHIDGLGEYGQRPLATRQGRRLLDLLSLILIARPSAVARP